MAASSPKKLREGWLIGVFVLLVLLICLAAAQLWTLEKQIQRDAVEQQLLAVADLKIRQLVAWRQERLADARLFQSQHRFNQLLNRLAQAAGDPALGQEFDAWAQALVRHQDYSAVILCGPNLEQCRVWPPNTPAKPVTTHPELAIALGTGEPLLTEFHPGQNGYLMLDLLIPIQTGTKVTALLQLRVDPAEYLFPMLEAWPIPSPTAEAQLVQREGDQVTYLTPLKGQSGSLQPLRISLQQTNILAVKAVLGQPGLKEGLDYRGERVVSCVRKMAHSSWFLVTKMDLDEALAQFRGRSRTLTGVAAALVVLVALALALLWHRRAILFARQELDLAQRFSTILHQANDAILLLDEQQRVVEANGQAARMYGCTAEQLANLDARRLQARPEAGDWATVHQEGSLRHTAWHRRQDGTTFPVEASASVVVVAGIRYTQCIIRDVTERHRMDEELRRRNKEISQIVYVASHDLRSPLVNVQGFSREIASSLHELEQILARAVLPAPTRERLRILLRQDIGEYMGFIQASTRQMDRLLAGLLQVSRLGRVEIKPIRLDMNRVVAESLHALDFQLQSCSARVEVLPLPPCQGDLGQVSQVFTNLFGNAIKYHHPQRPLRLHISGSVQQGEAIYCVADNGIGIAANNQEKIFELFHRLDPQGSEGDGLGLTIVRTILDRLNGRVWVESRPEDGCRFYVALPSV